MISTCAPTKISINCLIRQKLFGLISGDGKWSLPEEIQNIPIEEAVMIRTRAIFSTSCRFWGWLGFALLLAAPCQAQNIRIQVEVLEIRCGNTEDVTGADEFYLVSALSDGVTPRGNVTRPLDINDNQTKTLPDDQKVLYEASVPVGKSVVGGMIAYDEDYAKDWAKQKEMITKVTDKISDAAKSSDNKNANKAGWILQIAVQAWDLVASADKDDELGRIELNLPADGPAQETMEWKFEHKDSIGFSSWEYTVKYRINRTR